MKSDLLLKALEINVLCVNNQINLLPRWIPRNLNQEADILSRTGDSDDWSVSQVLFDVLNTKWGPYTVDRFANDYNAKCSKI